MNNKHPKPIRPLTAKTAKELNKTPFRKRMALSNYVKEFNSDYLRAMEDSKDRTEE